MSSVVDMHHRLELRDIPGKGQGVVSSRNFKAGDTLCIGAVQRILHNHQSNATQIADKRYVLMAGLMSMVKHSCHPNCGIRANAAGVPDLVAMRDGVRGEEITYDYAMQNYDLDSFPKICECGSPECRTFITGYRFLSDVKRKEYEGFCAPYLLELSVQKIDKL